MTPTKALHNMSNSLEARFTISRDEYVRAIRRYYKTILHPKRDLVGSVIAILAGSYLLRTSTAPMLAWLLIAVGAILLLLVVYALILLPHLLYGSQPKLLSEYRLCFSDDGIGFHTDEIAAELKWSVYHSWNRDNEFYILYHGKHDVTVIPRRALDAESDLRLSELLGKRIGKARA
jgi:hypothetical protein